MSHKIDLSQMSTTELAEKCVQETNRFFDPGSDESSSHDPRYCFELFQRAVVMRDNEAWGALYTQYYAEMASWARKRSYFSLVENEEDGENLIALAFERFWKYYTPKNFSQARGLGDVLVYLKKCVITEISNFSREMRKNRFAVPMKPNTPSREPKPADILQDKELLQHVLNQAKDEKERTVIYASMVLCLPPREILIEYPGVFSDIKEINQCKANILARFRRNPELRKFLDPDA